ncbi:MAG TPA: hypothetical protein VFX98_01910, partial [Longimicrobiaceae bacterium]|nr:hypothetical protein [Longimicrobiaceae bacterium]
ARRTEATTPPEVRTESRPAGAGDAPVPAGEGSEDATRAAAHARQAEENRDALEEQARRTEATTPPELR